MGCCSSSARAEARRQESKAAAAPGSAYAAASAPAAVMPPAPAPHAYTSTPHAYISTPAAATATRAPPAAAPAPHSHAPAYPGPPQPARPPAVPAAAAARPPGGGPPAPPPPPPPPGGPIPTAPAPVKLPKKEVPGWKGEWLTSYMKRDDHRTVKVFLSSTFRDMQEERRVIFTAALPRLQRECAARGLLLVFVDLRWGITEEEAKSGNVVLLCLREVQNSKYFVAFLKDRYGWCRPPGASDPAYDKSVSLALEAFPWVQQYDGRSVTELEILCGALLDPSSSRSRSNSLFYFASPEMLARERAKGEAPESPFAVEQLAALKAQIRRAGLTVGPEYGSEAELAEALERDLAAMIARDNAGKKPPTWLQQEAAAHDGFAQVRRRIFVGRVMAMHEIDSYAEGADNSILCVTGTSGSGKSALVANWQEHWRNYKGPRDTTVVHFCGGTSHSSLATNLVRRVYETLRERMEWVPPLELPPGADSRAALCQFGTWLGSLAAGLVRNQARVVIVVDALDQLSLDATTRDGALLFLPPGGASGRLRIVLSTAEGPTLDAIMQLQPPPEVLRVEPFTPAERREMIDKYCRMFSKRAAPDVLERIASVPQSGNALWLATVLSYLTASGNVTHDTLARELDAMLVTRTPAEAYRFVMERWARSYGPALVRGVLAAVACSRQGMADGELKALLSVGGAGAGAAPSGGAQALPAASALAWADFMGSAAASGALVDRGGLLGFYHKAAQQAAEALCELADEATRRAEHARAARWWEAQPPSERRAVEGTHAFERAGDPDGLARILADVDVLERLRSLETQDAELLRLWVASGRQPRAAEAYGASIARAESEGIEAARLARLLRDAGAVVRQLGFNAAALPLLRRALQVQRGLPASRERDEALPDIHRELACALDGVGEFEEAERLYRAALQERERLLGPEHPLTAEAAGNLGAALHRAGLPPAKHDEAEALFRRALATFEKTLGPQHPKAAIAWANWGTLQDNRGLPQEAAAYTERALAILEAAHGPQALEVGIACTNLCNAYLGLGDPARALAYAGRAEPIFKRFYGDLHVHTATVVCNAGYALLTLEPADVPGALAKYDEALRIRQSLHGPYHLDTCRVVAPRALALAHESRGAAGLREAERALEQYIAQARTAGERGAALYAAGWFHYASPGPHRPPEPHRAAPLVQEAVEIFQREAGRLGELGGGALLPEAEQLLAACRQAAASGP